MIKPKPGSKLLRITAEQLQTGWAEMQPQLPFDLKEPTIIHHRYEVILRMSDGSYLVEEPVLRQRQE